MCPGVQCEMWKQVYIAHISLIEFDVLFLFSAEKGVLNSFVPCYAHA
jgi:hypothetical protein